MINLIWKIHRFTFIEASKSCQQFIVSNCIFNMKVNM
uniref:Uncharacterized protein n=1 Tax=Setaria italica TaxID=4555 RepID=K3Z194_SETIT